MSKIRYVTEHGEAKSMATEQLLDIASNYCNDRLGAIEELEKKVSTLHKVGSRRHFTGNPILRRKIRAQPRNLKQCHL